MEALDYVYEAMPPCPKCLCLASHGLHIHIGPAQLAACVVVDPP